MADQGVVLSARDSVALEEIRVEQPGPAEVLVRIDATGVCHSDLHVIEEDGWHHAYPVLLGRPYAYALAVGGQRGVEELIQNLMAEIDLTLALAGAHSVRDLDRSWLSAA